MKKYSKLYSAQLSGLEAQIVTIEADISSGLHSFTVVGLADKAVSEARDRISSAIKNSGFESPKQKNHKLVISLSPANQKKEGSRFDMAMAVSYLLASGRVSFDTSKKLFIGELSLDGSVLPVNGILPIVYSMNKLGFEEIFLPADSVPTIAPLDGIKIFPITNLRELFEHMSGKSPVPTRSISDTRVETYAQESTAEFDIANIVGHDLEKRALMVAAIGRHNILLSGPPGVGKTMLARAFGSILPDLDAKEAIEVACIYSAANSLGAQIDTPPPNRPPFRNPHHTSSYAAIVGGGSPIRPGEITLAHRGVLFLDELPEFQRKSIESIRQPIEEGSIKVSRSRESVTYPADFILVGAMNPCPCGYGDSRCTCSEPERHKYRTSISGAILDRIDIHLSVSRLHSAQLQSPRNPAEPSTVIREKILQARSFASQRKDTNLGSEAKNLLTLVAEQSSLSNRAHQSIVRVARSIADLELSDVITKEHLLEALQYRLRD